MDRNSSSVCVEATIHNEQQQHKLANNDNSMPLYATVIPSNARKNRQKQLPQQQPPTERVAKHQIVCSSKALYSNTPTENQRTAKSTDDINGNDAASSTSDESDNQTVELWSHEIPVWIKGEQRWISGVTDLTTCLDLIEALLIDEGVIKATASDNNNNQEKNTYPTRVSEFVITERWRRVEQVLDPRTKILKIWAAWGAEQSEVKFSLKRRSDSHHSSSSTTHQSLSQTLAGERDSGRESPTGSINSAIVRRRRHRKSKSTMVWMTHGQTIHPKSQKSNIERLMKLILEQGEVIQQQLSKLRERDLEISLLEDERHKTREKEHGKNYLLEAYLKGLPDADDKQETAAGNSDSGVHTETAASPVVNDDEAALLPTIEDDEKTTADSTMKKHRRSRREHELMMEHQSTKQFSSAIREEWKMDEATATVASSSSSGGNKNDKGEATSTSAAAGATPTIDNEVAAQIDILEKLIVLNKHLQREEELCVRLSAKIKRYEADASGLTESQVRDSLKRVNEQLEEKQAEISMLEMEIKASDEVLDSKTKILKDLYDECEECEVEEKKSSFVSAPDVVASTSMPKALPPTKTEKFHSLKDDELSMSREYLAENIYNISKIILKSNGHPQNLIKSINQPTSGSIIATADFNRPIPESSSSNSSPPTSIDTVVATTTNVSQLSTIHRQQPSMLNGNHSTNSIDKRTSQLHMLPTSQINLSRESSSQPLNPHAYHHHQQPQQPCKAYNDAMRTSMNYLETINQRIQKINHLDIDINSLSNNPIIQANQYKLGPKKLLINTPNMNGNLNSVNNIYKRNLILQPNGSPSSATNYGIDMVDASQLGTLV